MKLNTILGQLALAGAVASGGAAVAAGPSAAMLGNTCAGCHGTDGASLGPATPSLAGMNSEYFIESMTAYKNGGRPATVMSRIAKGYGDDEIKRMADFFAGQKFVRVDQDTDTKLVRQGKRVHERYCEKCHEDGGRQADDGGILAGQWMPYLRYSFDDFTSGRREMPEKMKTKVDEMLQKTGTDAIEQLVHFYGSQK